MTSTAGIKLAGLDFAAGGPASWSTELTLQEEGEGESRGAPVGGQGP